MLDPMLNAAEISLSSARETSPLPRPRGVHHRWVTASIRHCLSAAAAAAATIAIGEVGTTPRALKFICLVSGLVL